MKTMRETILVLGCLLFWAVTLPLAGLVEIGIVVTDSMVRFDSDGLS